MIIKRANGRPLPEFWYMDSKKPSTFRLAFQAHFWRWASLERKVLADFLSTSFKWYITTDEQEIFVRITTGDVNEDDVSELLGNYQTYSHYTKRNISKIVTELAHQEIIRCPRYIAHCWAPIVAKLKDHVHFRTSDIVAFTAQQSPTTKKVIKAINCNPLKQWCRKAIVWFFEEIHPILWCVSTWDLSEVHHRKRHCARVCNGFIYIRGWFSPQTHCPHLWTTFGVAKHLPVARWAPWRIHLTAARQRCMGV